MEIVFKNLEGKKYNACGKLNQIEMIIIRIVDYYKPDVNEKLDHFVKEYITTNGFLPNYIVPISSNNCYVIIDPDDGCSNIRFDRFNRRGYDLYTSLGNKISKKGFDLNERVLTVDVVKYLTSESLMESKVVELITTLIKLFNKKEMFAESFDVTNNVIFYDDICSVHNRTIGPLVKHKMKHAIINRLQR